MRGMRIRQMLLFVNWVVTSIINKQVRARVARECKE